jgi:hypothetical protein
MHTTTQQELLKLNIQTLEAHMNDVGWLLQNDEYAGNTLEYIIVHWLVQSAGKSGTDVWGAFKFPDPSSQRPARVQEPVEGDCDTLDA